MINNSTARVRSGLRMFSAFLLTLGLLIFAASAWAQSRSVTGKVTSAEDGAALPGVNVVVKGTTTGTVTDVDGNYRISVSGDDAVLSFSFIGFEELEARVGNRSVVNVELGSDTEQLEEVVFTSQAIERERRSLGYGISNVDGKQLTVARESNVVNSLQGKVTGVQITQQSGNLGGSSRILVRGVTSLDGNNNPLWIVDGIPINNDQTATDSRITGTRDTFNGAAVLNPDDIESINVMKGAAAAALYGSRAAAGVIIVTTKRGEASGTGKPRISVNSSVRFDNLFRAPNFQNEYSVGDFGRYDSTIAVTSWGTRIEGQEVFNGITREREPLTANPDNYKDFFRQGITLQNNVSVSDANERYDYRLSITSLNQEGILPNASLDRITANLNAGVRHSDWLKTSFGIQYINTSVTGTGAAGANDQNIISVADFGRSIDYNDYKPWIDESGNQINFVVGPSPTNNPFWIRNENRNDRDNDRFIGNFTTTITPIEQLNITSRIGYDLEFDDRFFSNRVGTFTALTGNFRVDGIERRQFNIDVIADYTYDKLEDFTFTALAGFNYNNRVFEREELFAQDQSVPELFAPSNSLSTVPSRDFSQRKLYGIYGNIVGSYKNWLTLELTARNDWSSTLPLDNNSYFYPSASLAFVFTDAFQIANNILSYGKLRASAAQVGNDTDPYRLLFTFAPEEVADAQYSLDLNFPYDGRLGYNKPFTIPNAALQPERQTSYEVGAELGFFDGRVGLDVTYFNSVNENQIIELPIPESTGFGQRIINSGSITTSGVEATLTAEILNVGGFQWNTTVNYTDNNSVVDELSDEFDIERQLVASGFNSVQVVATPGEQFQLFAIPYLRDSASGRPIVDPDTGLRQSGDARTFGDVIPEFTWGFINQISYKGVTLSVTIDGQQGGLLRSATIEDLWVSGLTDETAVNREGTYIDTEAVILNDDGTVRDNDVPARSTQDLWESIDNNSVAEATIFDGTFIKLREVGLSYNFPRSVIESTPFTNIQIGVEGRNVALLYSKVPHIDPEASLFGSGGGFNGIERNTVPSTRSIGFNVRLNF